LLTGCDIYRGNQKIAAAKAGRRRTYTVEYSDEVYEKVK
jgi:hypothetical protein